MRYALTSIFAIGTTLLALTSPAHAANDKTTYEVIVEKPDDKDIKVTVDAAGKILSEKPIEEGDDDDDEDQ